MGLNYVLFRVWFLIQKKTGLLIKRFPANPPFINAITLVEWKKSIFFVKSKEELTFPKIKVENLKNEAESILKGDYLFFSSTKFTLGVDYDWVTNPDTGFKYDITKHWSEINDYSSESGDIKYVWEKSRFSFLNTIIRYDYHFCDDQSEFVFNEIENWIDKNPINMGPNYVCSQEMAIRCFNWIFALNYYKNSENLTNNRFLKIINTIYWHADHIYKNIKFSKIAVRNNHAITECLCIYTFGLFFPSFPDSAKWKRNGKKWFQNEISYQVYNDGTFLQFSMNYHRVLVQLFTWAIQINKLNDLPFSDDVYIKAKKSLGFLLSCMNGNNGMLPNYGANDGALFFKLGVQEFRDYRPQLEALSLSMGLSWPFLSCEDKYWFGLETTSSMSVTIEQSVLNSFKNGGYYIVNDNDDSTLTFVRCGSHRDRPSQADNLHLDLWINGDNILRDAGSYKYNTNDSDLNYFFGSKSHNTVTLGKNDQMFKGGRFIWYYWTQTLCAELIEVKDKFIFNGQISAFRQIDNKAIHKRNINKKKGIPVWEISDELIHNTNFPLVQYWHPSKSFFDKFEISAKTIDGSEIIPFIEEGYYSSLYGQKEPSIQIVFTTQETKLITTIKPKFR
jgi:hypothetical protein